MGRDVFRRMVSSSLRAFSTLSSAQASEPRPPACETATTMSDNADPAIGAWTNGSSMPHSLIKRSLGHMHILLIKLICDFQLSQKNNAIAGHHCQREHRH